MPPTWRTAAVVLLASLAASVLGAVQATADDDGWTTVETVDVLGYSPRTWTNLGDQGSIDVLGLQALEGDVRCVSIEFWFADGRQQYVPNRIYDEGEIAEFEIDGTNRTIQRVAFDCRPTMGVGSLQLRIMVR